MAGVTVGKRAEISFTVAAVDTAEALGSGDLPVLATPRAIAWVEAASCAAVGDVLDSDQTTVGTHVEIDHLLPSWVGAVVIADAMVAEVSGRRLRFQVRLMDAEQRVLLAGSVVRAIVNRDKFV
ncbi:MAG: thioesterase [Micrococcales bacterium]|nr:thioesterase [Micrococcales bacterium]